MGIDRIKREVKRAAQTAKVMMYELPKTILSNAFTDRVSDKVLGKKKSRGASGKW